MTNCLLYYASGCFFPRLLVFKKDTTACTNSVYPVVLAATRHSEERRGSEGCGHCGERRGSKLMRQEVLGAERKHAGHYELNDLTRGGGGFRVTYEPTAPQHSTILEQVRMLYGGGGGTPIINMKCPPPPPPPLPHAHTQDIVILISGHSAWFTGQLAQKQEESVHVCDSPLKIMRRCADSRCFFCVTTNLKAKHHQSMVFMRVGHTQHPHSYFLCTVALKNSFNRPTLRRAAQTFLRV